VALRGQRALAVSCFVPQAHAQVGPSPSPSPSPTPTPTPTPSPSPTAGLANAKVSTGNEVLNLGSSFLERLVNQSANGVLRAQRNNPGGGGASEATADGLRFRSWAEVYGVYITTSAQAPFVGDRRSTAGGVAGLGATLMPGVNIGFSVDQSRTNIDVPLALQSASLDLTQFGFNASVDKGPWTWAVAVVHGFGNINANRDTGFGIANSGYEAQLDGVLTEIDYYWTKDQNRIVPKAALEYLHSTTSPFQEVGGLDPVMESAQPVERSRLLLGAGSATTSSSARRSLTCPPTASSSTISRRISARSWSASARRASRSRASAKANMARIRVLRRH
jgi:uncharacterized protein with beta-barrel porin domain